MTEAIWETSSLSALYTALHCTVGCCVIIKLHQFCASLEWLSLFCMYYSIHRPGLQTLPSSIPEKLWLNPGYHFDLSEPGILFKGLQAWDWACCWGRVKCCWLLLMSGMRDMGRTHYMLWRQYSGAVMEQSCYAITVRSRPITDITTKPSAEVYVTIALNLK